MDQINQKNKVNITIESPWKKIVIVGALIVVFIIVTEVGGNYTGAYLEKINSNLLENSYFSYPALIIVILIIITSIFVFIRRYKSKQVITKDMKPTDVKPTGDIRDEDIKRVLKRVDELLEKLPQEEIDKFIGTKDSELYKSLLKKYGV